MTTLYLIRHGETAWNREGRFQGWLDSSLTDRGRAHADVNGALLARMGVARIWASPLGRVRETVAEIVKHVGVEAQFDERLKECNVGAWEGQTLAAIRDSNPADWQARAKDLFNHRPPGGESLADVHQRVAPFVASLVSGDGQGPDGQSVAIVSHGLMTRVILRVVLGADIIDVASTSTPNDGVYRLDWNDGIPEVSHFVAGVGPVPGLIPRQR